MKPNYSQTGESFVKGVSIDEPIVENAQGGRQSKSCYAFHLIDDQAILAIAERLQQGQDRGYARDNWRLIASEEHFNHMLVHYYAAKNGDTSDEHMKGFICRAMMTFATFMQEQEKMKS